MKHKISKSTVQYLKGVDARLTIIFVSYLMLGKKDIGVTYGGRTDEEQEKFLKEGKTQVKKGKHSLVKELLKTPTGYTVEVLEANAIDILAYENGKAVWNRAYYEDIIDDMKAIAKYYGWENNINWGWDFKTLDDPFHISVKEPGDGGIK